MSDAQPSTSAPAAAKASKKSKPTPTPAEPFGGRKGITDSHANVMNYVRMATCKNVWYYRDRCGVARGPATLPVMKEAWVHGIVDENTLVWGEGLADFLPIKNVRTLVPQIRTPEVRAATWVKKHIAIKPALAKARKERAAERTHQSDQVDSMR